MAKEIERKFLVDMSRLVIPADGEVIKQGYLPTSSNTAVRIRVKGNQAYLTLKGENVGPVRSEFEYAIPLLDATEMLDQFCGSRYIDKIRYEIVVGLHTWELDVFHGDNQGLIVAEIELTEEHESFQRPDWALVEVTGEPKYYNSSLVDHPFKDWG